MTADEPTPAKASSRSGIWFAIAFVVGLAVSAAVWRAGNHAVAWVLLGLVLLGAFVYALTRKRW